MVRADETGFACEFQIYTGKSGSTSEKQLGERVVKDLTANIIGGNHRVFFDNFFTSLNLMICLKSRNILACGTVKINRVGLPKKQKLGKNMEKGEHEFRTCNQGIICLL